MPNLKDCLVDWHGLNEFQEIPDKKCFVLLNNKNYKILNIRHLYWNVYAINTIKGTYFIMGRKLIRPSSEELGNYVAVSDSIPKVGNQLRLERWSILFGSQYVITNTIVEIEKIWRGLYKCRTFHGHYYYVFVK